MSKWLITRLASKRRNGRFREPRFEYNPMGYKRIRFERAEKQDHAMVKQEYAGNGEWCVIVCNCPVHKAYLDLIARLNPERYEALTHPEPPIIRKRSERDKQFSQEKQARELRGKTLGRTLSKRDRIDLR